jgi:hypothetical protein
MTYREACGQAIGAARLAGPRVFHMNEARFPRLAGEPAEMAAPRAHGRGGGMRAYPHCLAGEA